MELLAGVNRTLRRVLVARGVKSHLVRLRGQSIHHYTLDGQGPGLPLVLVHGLAGSANGWYKLFFALTRRFRRLHAVDLPGHGFSPLPPGGPNTLAEQVQILRAYLTEVVKEPCLLVGTSLGGAMAISVAAMLPEQIRGLVLVAPAGARFTSEQLAALERAMAIETVAEARTFTRRLFHKAPPAMLLFASELRKMYGIPPVRAVFSDAKELGAVPPEVLRGLKMPTLVLWSGSEQLLPPDGVDYFRAHLPPGGRVEVVPGVGHVPQMERPRELAARLSAFADTHAL